MRPRTFAREIAFQVLYREDLNPVSPGRSPFGDALLDQGRQTRELMEFVRHLAELSDQEDAIAADEGELFSQWLRTPSLVEFSRLLIQGVAAQSRRVGREDRRRGRELERPADGRHRSQPPAAGRLRDPLYRHARPRS